MRIIECKNPNYFEVDDGRVIHESSFAMLNARELLENYDEMEYLRGEFLRMQALSLEGAEAVALFSAGEHYIIDENGGIVAGKTFDFENFTVPDGIKTIKKSGFRGLKCLKSVTIPGSVEIIEEDAFNGCVNLEKVTFSYGLKKIMARAFYGSGISEILRIPASVDFIAPREVFPQSARTAIVDRNMPTEVANALFRCGLKVIHPDNSRWR